jgi:ribonuclease HII
MRRAAATLAQRFAALRAFDREFDPDAWASGRLAGVDEAGVGPLAGPVVAAAVVLPSDFELPELFDSKQLTPAARARCAAFVHRHALAIGVARISPQRIDKLNILRAMLTAHRGALQALALRPQAVLIDGRWTPTLPAGWTGVRMHAVVGGDGRSLAVAAASVIAKTTRDHIMERLDHRYPEYGFARHKGYGTAAHRAALQQHGLSPVHRRGFCTWLETAAMAARQGSFDFVSG